ncbi:glycerophosphoryl diester phosphodiesterase [Amycolatopsis marina]|uniref:Glycerophosphoryl diester phosphodiesterase n=1 Tax=Amycolatopsis marina TaxID=490629 RepID=A0A1I0VCC7_9PSEU|nr:glycerophosphodiester phosphodiesterase family protein [Amycolatopsis marina]SFA74069.1 glycerophosphoryl diester phosphodiesterase [Amycolatopsis marina]
MRLTLSRAFAAMSLSLLAVLAGTAPVQAEPGAVTDIAHRGSSGSAPENTVAAVQVALRQHASFVEVDVQRSADGELVVLHDVTLDRTTDAEEVFPGRAPWRVGDFTMAEIRSLDAGSWFADEFAGEPVPTLREVVNALGRRAGLLLEVKSPALYPGIEAEIHQELSDIPGYLPSALAAGNLVIQSFDHVSMFAYHEIAPEVPVGLLYGARPTEAELVAASEWADQINPSYRVTDRALVDRVHELGMTISVYTLNTGRLMRQYRNLGVDGIITDYPAVLRQILRERNL